MARSAYHRWASGKLSRRAAENEHLADTIEKIHEESPDKGYRRLNDDLRHDHGIHVNDKRVLRICRVRDIRSTIKYNNHGCTRRVKNPQYLAENLLDRQFYAAKPNEKWLTDVTEFKWFEGMKVQKLYLSAILDLCVLAPGAHSQFGSGKNTQFEPEQRANPFENVFSKTAVFPPPAIAETDL